MLNLFQHQKNVLRSRNEFGMTVLINMQKSGLHKTSLVKQTFSSLFLILIVVLMLLPFVTTFNELLTRIVESSLLYKPIEKYFVPYEVMLVRTVISWFGVVTKAGTIAVVKNGVNQGTFISWNCIGWQSFVILLISLKAGLSGNFTLVSKLETLIMGVLGTFFLNLGRISLVLILLYHVGRAPAVIFHDYAAVFLSIIWLFFFWWFSFNFILEERSVAPTATEK
jgi:exosortase/archaeosortase family protein